MDAGDEREPADLAVPVGSRSPDDAAEPVRRIRPGGSARQVRSGEPVVAATAAGGSADGVSGPGRAERSPEVG